MAEIIGCIALSHGPQLLMPPEKWQDLPTRVREPLAEKPELARELTPEVKQVKFKRCREAMDFLHRRLDEWNPDAVIIIGDDQTENILDDNTPPFLVYIGEQANATLKFEYLGEPATSQMTLYKTRPVFALSVIEGLMQRGFDPAWSKTTRYKAGMGHAFGRPLHFIMPDRRYPIVPIMVNTYFPPAPTAERCFQFGKALFSALKECREVDKVVVVGSGGLSHVMIDEKLDRGFINALETYNERYMAAMSSDVLVEGTSEIRNWIITAAVAGKGATMVDYVPCYRTMHGIGCAMGFAYWS